MDRKKACGGCFLRIAVGITTLVLLLAGGVGAVPIEQWNRTFGGINGDIAHSVQQTFDGGYILGGWTNGTGNTDAWLIKVSSEGYVHNINKGTDYSTIQSAIDDASAGNEIHVDSGTYYENVNVTKQLILRGIDNGGGLPVVNASGWGSAITLNAGWTIVDSFIAKNGGNDWENAGISVFSNNNIITNNTVSNNNYHGMYLSYISNNNTLTGNNVSWNRASSIILDNSDNNTLTGNNISSNYVGILVRYGSDNNTY